MPHITLIVNCRNKSVLKKHQKKIENRLKKWFCNTKLCSKFKLSHLNHDLKLTKYFRESLRNKQKLCERYRVLTILTGKKHPKFKLQRLRKMRIGTFGSLVHQINSFSEVLKLKQISQKNKAVTIKILYYRSI